MAKEKGRRYHFGSLIDKDIRKGKLWAADALDLGVNLTDYEGMKVRFVSPVDFEADGDDLYAIFDFFARFDTVYVLLYKDIAITTVVAHRMKGGK